MAADRFNDDPMLGVRDIAGMIEWRLGREYEPSTLFFGPYNRAKWPADLVAFAAGMAKGHSYAS